jgi:competence protein ComEA
MRAMTRATLAVLMSTIAFVGVTAASTSPPLSQATSSATPRAAQDAFPETTGKTALLKVCGNCHTAETVIQTMRTRLEWSEVIDQMARFGAEASDQEFEQILAYLAKHFSPIKVNKATAKDLEAMLDVPASVADTMVAYRMEKVSSRPWTT